MTNTSVPAARRALPAVLLLFIGLPLAAYPEIIFGRQTLWYRDITQIHYPLHIMVAGEWLAGRIPLWNPYQHLGIPLLAEGQVGPLYPLGLIFLSPLPPSLELSLFVVMHHALAGLFTLALARCLGLAWAPATVAGLAFGMGGFLSAQVSNLNIMTGAVWLPLILGAVILAVRRRSALLALLAGIPLAMQAFTAQPQVVFYTLIVVAAYGVYCLVCREGSWGGRLRGFLVAAAIVSGLLLSAPQLLPAFELQQHSVRAQDMGLGFLTKNSWPPTMGLNLLLPSAFGNNAVGFKGGDPFEEDFLYVGFIPLALACFGWRQWRRPDMPFFILLLIGATLLALGRFTPLYAALIQYLPGFSLFRIPSRWLMVVNLALAVLAGYGLQALLERGLSRRRLVMLLAVMLVLALGLALVWAFRAGLLEWTNAHWAGIERKLAATFLERGFAVNPLYQERIVLRWLIPLTAPAGLLAFNLGVAMLLFTLFGMRRVTARTFSALALAAISLDLVIAGGAAVNPVRPDEWWTGLSGGAHYVLEHLRAGRVFPLGMGSEEAAVRKLGQFFPSAYHVRSAGGHGSPLMLARHDALLHTAHPVQLVQLLGVRYILTEGRMGQDAESTYPPVFMDDESVVYENRHPLPRAFAVHDVIRADDPEEALTYFKHTDLDPRRTAVLEAPASAALPSPTQVDGEEQVVITHDDPDVVEVRARLAGDGYLVLLDTWYPGWGATLDGRPAPIYRADYIVRAVFVPAGEHVVRFEYRPSSFLGGMAAAVMMLAVIVVVALRARPVTTLNLQEGVMNRSGCRE